MVSGRKGVFDNEHRALPHINCACLLSQLHLSFIKASIQLDLVDCRCKSQVQAVCRQGTRW